MTGEGGRGWQPAPLDSRQTPAAAAAAAAARAARRPLVRSPHPTCAAPPPPRPVRRSLYVLQQGGHLLDRLFLREGPTPLERRLLDTYAGDIAAVSWLGFGFCRAMAFHA